ncbi:hypothetical protein SBA2_580013 [Acidobacteriia bacterium SbA2]|nr:hypothetical protein SBA2_580013 [Acidobacteriia bacterium SbA2]
MGPSTGRCPFILSIIIVLPNSCGSYICMTAFDGRLEKKGIRYRFFCLSYAPSRSFVTLVGAERSSAVLMFKTYQHAQLQCAPAM